MPPIPGFGSATRSRSPGEGKCSTYSEGVELVSHSPVNAEWPHKSAMPVYRGVPTCDLPIPTDVTLSLPRGARVVQSAVANDRLVMTLEIDGKLEVRTFDVKTLQPVGRLNFSATP